MPGIVLVQQRVQKTGVDQNHSLGPLTLVGPYRVLGCHALAEEFLGLDGNIGPAAACAPMKRLRLGNLDGLEALTIL